MLIFISFFTFKVEKLIKRNMEIVENIETFIKVDVEELIVEKKVETQPLNKDEVVKNEDEMIVESEEKNKIRTTEVKTDHLIYWKIEIPKIDLDANISSGTTESVLNEYVGHFENTSKKDGNVGLAAHNRGYPVNFFANIKNLDMGDIIKYTIGNTIINYKVISNDIIADTDWSKLSATNDDRITLITCVENKPSLRRCVQGISTN